MRKEGGTYVFDVEFEEEEDADEDMDKAGGAPFSRRG